MATLVAFSPRGGGGAAAAAARLPAAPWARHVLAAPRRLARWPQAAHDAARWADRMSAVADVTAVDLQCAPLRFLFSGPCF